MKYECDMIADLLPLYKDGACSESSSRIVKEHLEECDSCKKMLEMLNDSKLDEEIIKEKEEVIDSQARFFKRKSAIVGTVIASIFAIPILACLIVDLATGAGLSWFFIVLVSMFIPASLIVVPLMVPQNRMFCSMVTFTLSIILLLGICCLYSHGSWFFIAASSVLFGLTVCFAPFIVNRRPVKSYLGNFKGLTFMIACTLTFVLMMICIGVTTGALGFFKMAFGISAPCWGVVWIIFLIIRYLPGNGFIKAGSVIVALSIFTYFINDIIGLFVTRVVSSDEVMVYSTTPAISLVGGLVVGCIFLLIGIIVKVVGGKKNEAN